MAGVYKSQLQVHVISETFPWLPVDFNIPVLNPIPMIIQLNPSHGSEKGGDLISLHASGFPKSMQLEKLMVRFGLNITAPVLTLLSDSAGSFMSFLTPRHYPKLTSIEVQFRSEGKEEYSLLLKRRFNSCRQQSQHFSSHA